MAGLLSFVVEALVRFLVPGGPNECQILHKVTERALCEENIERKVVIRFFDMNFII